MSFAELLIRVFMMIYFLLTLGDVFSTGAALSRPGVREANPVMALFQKWLGGGWVLIRVAFGLAAIYAAVVLYPDWRGVALLWLGCAVLVFVVANNIRVAHEN